MGKSSNQSPPAATSREIRIVSFDGGGYLGLATAAFVEEVETHLGTAFADAFDFFAGTSTGSIIACCLAAGRSGSEVARLYQDLGPDVFPSRLWSRPARLMRWPFVARYGNKALRDHLEETLGETTIEDVLKREKYLLVPTYCVSSGSPTIFKTDHSEALDAHGRYRLADVALASCAAPTYLPLVDITRPPQGARQTFCDGGVVANHPALLALVEAVHELDATSVRVLSVSTPRSDLAERVPRWRRSRGIFGWAAKLPNVFIESNMSLAHQLMVRLRTMLKQDVYYERVELVNSRGLRIDDAGKAAQEQLVNIGHEKGKEGDTRSKVRAVVGPLGSR